jgi:hypothetical protein
MNFKTPCLKTLLCAVLAASPWVQAQVVDVKGEAEVSIKANGGDLIAARRLVREAAERDTIAA